MSKIMIHNTNQDSLRHSHETNLILHNLYLTTKHLWSCHYGTVYEINDTVVVTNTTPQECVPDKAICHINAGCSTMIQILNSIYNVRKGRIKEAGGYRRFHDARNRTFVQSMGEGIRYVALDSGEI